MPPGTSKEFPLPPNFQQVCLLFKKERKKQRGNLGLRLFALLGPFFCSKFKKKQRTLFPKVPPNYTSYQSEPMKSLVLAFQGASRDYSGKSRSLVTTKTSRPFFN